MLDTKESKNTATSYQAAWDERLKKHKQFSRLVNYGFSILIIGLTTWFGIEIFNNILTTSAETDPIAKHELVQNTGGWFTALIFEIFFLGMISIPFFRAVGWSEWALGERPADDYKPREAQPIDVSIEQVNEDVRYFHVSGLHRPDENYTFKVERRKDSRAFRKPEYSYTITEKDNKIGLHYTLSGSCFTGLSDDEITKNLIDTISFQLEEYTDHFKELNFAI